tara:strand:- start:11526 stop:13802 length:2277 start_codon:yes stop_codon:yes gene_type:complete
MALTPGTTPQSMQGLASAGQGMMNQDDIMDKENARKDAANQADIARKDAQAKLKMSLDHSAGMQSQQITSNENIESQRLADSQKGRDDAAIESEKGRQFTGAQNQIQQQIMMLMHQKQRDDIYGLQEFQRGQRQGAPVAGAGGTGGTVNMTAQTYGSQQPPSSQFQYGSTGGLGAYGQYFTPEQRLVNEQWQKDSIRQIGFFKGEQDLARMEAMKEYGDVGDSLGQYTTKLTELLQQRLSFEEQFGAELTAENAAMFAPGGNIFQLVTRGDASQISGAHKMGNTLDQMTNLSITGGAGPVLRPLENSEDLPLYKELQDSETGWGPFSGMDEEGFQEIVQGTESEAKQSAFKIAEEKYGMTLPQFKKTYDAWADADDPNQIRSYEMGTFGKTSSKKGFNNYLAMELAGQAGLDLGDDAGLLQNARGLIGATQINPVLSAESVEMVQWGQKGQMGFTAADSSEIQIRVLNQLANNFEGKFQGVGATLKKIAPMLIQYANSTTGTPKEREAAAKEIMGVFNENKGVHFQPIMQIMSSFHDQRQNLGNMMFSDEVKEQLKTATGGRGEDYDKAIGALEKGYDGLANLSAVFRDITGAEHGVASSSGMVQGMLQAIAKKGLSGSTHVTTSHTGQPITQQSLDEGWAADMYNTLVTNGDKSIPLEIREQRVALLFEAAQSSRDAVDKEWGEAEASMDPLRQSYDDVTDWYDDVYDPWNDERIALGQEQDETRYQTYKTDRETADTAYDDEMLDVITGGKPKKKP